MDGKRWILTLLLIIGAGSVYGQSFQYTYTDPCTGLPNTITITQPTGSVTLFYAGQYQNFTQLQLLNGAYEQWVQSLNAQFPPGFNPCAGNTTQITTTANVSNTTNLVNNISNIVGIAAGIGSQAAGSVNIPPPTNTSSSGGSNTNGGSNGSGGSGGSSNGSDGGSGGSGSGGGSGGGNEQPSSGGGETGNTGGGTDGGVDGGTAGTQENTTTASGGESESGGGGGSGGGGNKPKSKQEKIGRGSLIGSGDMVVIRNGNNIEKGGNDNYRFNTSLTHVNTKQNFIKGVNFNYTTGENVLNTTLYGSYKTKKFMGVFSNSIMTNFKSDIFNTTTMLAAQKIWKFTGMLGTNYTFGKLGDAGFQNWSVVAGGFTNFKGGKFLTSNIMLLGVYSPYVFYYGGQWYNNGVLLVPLTNIDMKLTNKFKLSVSFGGAYQYGQEILNFQISTGAKMLL